MEQRTLKAYRNYLHRITTEDMQALCLSVFGPPVGRFGAELIGVKAYKQFQDREARLDEDVPELVQLLRGEEQQRICALLLDQHDLAGFAKAVISLDNGNGLKKRDLESTLEDAYLFKAAGLGKLSRRDTAKATEASKRLRGLPTGGPPLELKPWAPIAKKPVLRTKKRRTHKAHVLLGQFSIWPPVSAGAQLAGVL